MRGDTWEGGEVSWFVDLITTGGGSRSIRQLTVATFRFLKKYSDNLITLLNFCSYISAWNEIKLRSLHFAAVTYYLDVLFTNFTAEVWSIGPLWAMYNL